MKTLLLISAISLLALPAQAREWYSYKFGNERCIPLSEIGFRDPVDFANQMSVNNRRAKIDWYDDANLEPAVKRHTLIVRQVKDRKTTLFIFIDDEELCLELAAAEERMDR